MINKRILDQLQELRRSLPAAERGRDGSFSGVFKLFLDISEDPGFIKASKVTKAPLVKGALERVAEELAGDEPVKLAHVLLLRVAEVGMVHGGFFLGSKVGSLFFFEKEEQGLMAIHQGGPMMLYSRLTMTVLPPGTVPVPRAGGLN